jgi:two-component system OmpR family sensor kinase
MSEADAGFETGPPSSSPPQPAAHPPTRLRDRIHIRRFGTWTLRSRLVLAMVALLAVVSIVIGLISVLALQSSLMGRLDQQLDSAVDRGRSAVLRDPGSFGGNPNAPINAVVGARGQPTGTFGALISGGNILAGGYLDPSATTKSVTVHVSQLLSIPRDARPRTINLGSGLGEYRVVAATLPTGDGLVIGLPLSEVNGTLSQLIVTLIVITVLGLALLAVAGTFIVRLALRPLERMTGAALQVSELPLDSGDVALAVRVPESDADTRTEVGTMGAALNRMLGHIGSALTARQNSEKKVRQFVADASHELRTPLASIRGYAELTRRSPHELPADVTRSIGRIESEATRMTSLVEDLLLLARLDEGRDLERKPVDLTSMLIDAVSDAHAAGPDHVWSLELPEEPVEVPGDAARLQQVVTNLLANARVHTPEGTAVTAGIAVVSEPEPRAVITVSDNGPGIPEDLQPTLFERFVRGDGSRSRATGSTGLGLAIVHAVVEAHGGEVTVTSEPGATAFAVSLPLAAVDPLVE